MLPNILKNTYPFIISGCRHYLLEISPQVRTNITKMHYKLCDYEHLQNTVKYGWDQWLFNICIVPYSAGNGLFFLSTGYTTYSRFVYLIQICKHVFNCKITITVINVW